MISNNDFSAVGTSQNNDPQLQNKLLRIWLQKNIFVNKKLFVNAKVGNIKDDYYFEKNVGNGAFGVVYRAKNRLTLKSVAIKAIQKFKISNYQAFIKEYTILSEIDHPNIVNIKEIWEWDKMFFLVTEFCNGGDLFSYTLERNVIAERDVEKIIKQCLSALIYLNQNDICHRDIKLENIMLQEVDDLSNIKIIDFGLSKDVKRNGQLKSLCSGSPFYIAPEVLQNEVSLACDIWSLGIVMYVCLTGKLLFMGESQDEIF